MTLAQRLLAARGGADTGEFIPIDDPRYGQRFTTDDQGRQYDTVGKTFLQPLGYDAGGKYTYDPSSVSQLEQSKALHKANVWNPQTGVYDPGSIDWGALGSVIGGAGIGAAVAAPAIAGALSSSAGGAGASTVAPSLAQTGEIGLTTTPLATGGTAAGTLASAIPAASSIGTGAGAAGTTGASAVTAGASQPASLISRVLGGLKDISPVLSNAAANEANANRYTDQFNLRAAEDNATLPGTRYRTALRAALPSMTTPYTIHWGGPGSGLRGEIPTTSGGIDWSKMPPELAQLRDQLIHDELMQQLAGPIRQTPTSAGDKALGIAGTIAGIGGAASRWFR